MDLECGDLVVVDMMLSGDILLSLLAKEKSRGKSMMLGQNHCSSSEGCK